MTSSAIRNDRLVRPRHVVTAVLVAHDGARWLPTTLHAVKTQRRPVQRFVAVDTDSHDDSRELLERTVGASSVIRRPPGDRLRRGGEPGDFGVRRRTRTRLDARRFGCRGRVDVAVARRQRTVVQRPRSDARTRRRDALGRWSSARSCATGTTRRCCSRSARRSTAAVVARRGSNRASSITGSTTVTATCLR